MITVHVGLHKTGSTSIQAALAMVEHRLPLLVVPPTAAGIWASPERLEAVADASRTGHVIISDEGILGGMGDAYSSAAQRLDAVSRALSGLQYEIVLYLRPQPSWLSSVYLQLVQEGGVESSREFWESIRARPLLEWASLCDVVNRHGGASRVRVRAHIPGRDAVEDFFVVGGLGAAPRPTSLGIRINESISAVQAPILAALNGDDSLSPDARQSLRSVFQGLLAAGADRSWSPFPEDVQAQMVAQYRADWLSVAQMLEATDPGEARVFRESSALWDVPVRPFAGSAVGDPAVSAELLRSLTVLAQAPRQDGHGLWRRALVKARDRPGDLPRAVRAALRRRPRA